MVLIWSPAYEVDIGAHVFPTAKYRLVLESLTELGVMTPEDTTRPEPAPWDQLGLVHAPEYLGKIRENALSPLEQMVLEVPFSVELREASRLCCGGTLLAGEAALARGVAVHLGGGFHHAFRDHGEGFCLLNDVAVGAAVLLDRQEVSRIAVVLLGSGELFRKADGDATVAVAFRPGSSRVPPGERVRQNVPGVVLSVLSHFGQQESRADEHSLENLLLNFLIDANVARLQRLGGRKQR